jgi:hypothetical protein
MWHSDRKSHSQAVGDLAGIDLVVLLLGRCNRSQHQRVSRLNLRGMREAGDRKSSR